MLSCTESKNNQYELYLNIAVKMVVKFFILSSLLTDFTFVARVMLFNSRDFVTFTIFHFIQIVHQTFRFSILSFSKP